MMPHHCMSVWEGGSPPWDVAVWDHCRVGDRLGDAQAVTIMRNELGSRAMHAIKGADAGSYNMWTSAGALTSAMPPIPEPKIMPTLGSNPSGSRDLSINEEK